MSAVARLLRAGGHDVTGSDVKRNRQTDTLAQEGVKCFIGHSAGNVGDAGAIVYSTSIRDDNPEIREARRRGLETIHRAEMLSRLAAGKRVIAVTGAHGKTTTTSLLALILSRAGLDPSTAVGGVMANFGTNAFAGKGDFFVIEADESDGSFLRFRPERLVVTNIDREHLEYYGDIGAIKAAHVELFKHIRKGGTLYFLENDVHMRQIIGGFGGRKRMFGMRPPADIYAADVRPEPLGSRFLCKMGGAALGEMNMPVPGTHHICNALAAVLVALDIGIDFKDIALAVESYKGTKRRFEIKGEIDGVTVIEDYAHHPAEIRAVLDACAAWNRPVITVFQPHRYTRTKELFAEFVEALKGAGRLILTDIYAASEEPIDGIDAEALRRRIAVEGNEMAEVMRKDDIAKSLASTVKPGDIVLVLGAGDISSVAEELTAALRDGRREAVTGKAVRI